MTILLQSATAPATGEGHRVLVANRTYQATVTGTGAVAAEVVIEGSNDNQNYLTIMTITLSGTSVHSDGDPSDAPWLFVRARLASISGTGAAVTAIMGVPAWQY